MVETLDSPTKLRWTVVGPWDYEPDRALWRDPTTARPCLLIRDPKFGDWVGFVGVEPGHHRYGTRGPIGLPSQRGTQFDHSPDWLEPKQVWWLGFHGHGFRPGDPVETGDLEYKSIYQMAGRCAELASNLGPNPYLTGWKGQLRRVLTRVRPFLSNLGLVAGGVIILTALIAWVSQTN